MDTGAGDVTLLLDKTRAEHLQVRYTNSANVAFGLGSHSVGVHSAQINRVAIGDLAFDSLKIKISDLSKIVMASQAAGQVIDGIIGAAFLTNNGAIIDYHTNTLYLRKK
jgi:AICAR transformylase/IMP cyclohydrolase PurH